MRPSPAHTTSRAGRRPARFTADERVREASDGAQICGLGSLAVAGELPPQTLHEHERMGFERRAHRIERRQYVHVNAQEDRRLGALLDHPPQQVRAQQRDQVGPEPLVH